jgi:2,5-diketo-D-gluconate reductase B
LRYVQLNGVSVPALGLGTWQMSGSECREAVQAALALGYRHIDTARMYENEAAIGEALEASDVPRSELFLTTKLWLEDLTEAQVPRATAESLERLRTDYVDLLLIHWPHPEVPLRETLGAMQALQEEGKVRHLGVSNFPPGQLRAALELAPIVCNQVEHHVYLAQAQLHRMAQDHGLMLTAYCPLARGQVLEDPVLKEIAQRHGKGPAQVALRWLIQRDRVCAIPKASSVDHMKANFDIFDFELTDDEMQRIAGLDRGERLINPSFAPDWSA